MVFVYVLQNQQTGRHYTGSTADLIQRLGQHNHGITKSTKNPGVWNLLYQEAFATRAEAMCRERFLKSGKGREELRAILALKKQQSGRLSWLESACGGNRRSRVPAAAGLRARQFFQDFF